MAVYFFIAICALSILAAFKIGLLSALGFFGTTAIPVIAMPAIKWGLLRGKELRHKIGSPVFGAILLCFAYWLSTGASLELFGLHFNGILLFAISCVVGLVGAPMSWAEESLHT